jgi:hypothetical protein
MSTRRLPTTLATCRIVRQLSTSSQLSSGGNKPRNSGDRGPERNYVKKVMKKANKSDDTVGIARTTFMNALKAIESGESVPRDEQTLKAQEDEL